MSTTDPSVVRYDQANPEDLAAMIANGLVWSLAPEVQEAAVNALVADPSLMNDRVPDDIRAFIEESAASRAE